MPRSRRSTAAAGNPQSGSPQPTTAPRLPEWRWRTFPVFFAFVVGALCMAVLNGAPRTDVAAAAQLVALAALSYGLARIFVRKVFIERRVERRERQIARGEEPADDYEDVAVYRGESRKKS